MIQDYKKTNDGYEYEYPRAAMTADAVVLCRQSGEWELLLIKRGNEPYKDCWALPGGFLNMDETLEDCARRELEEETTMKYGSMQFVGLYDKPCRDPRGRVITAAFLAVLDSKPPIRASDDAAQARWWKLAELPELAFDHDKIITDAAKML